MKHVEIVWGQKLLLAFSFAERAHRGQVRKYTGEPYIVHPIEVAQYAMSVGLPEPAICAAMLHDVPEDCGVTINQIHVAFGDDTAQYVDELTDIARKWNGNRDRRTTINREHSAGASAIGQSLKVCDIISNSKSITLHDTAFAKVFMDEKAQLLAELRHAHPALLAHANGLLASWREMTGETV